ncbi:uncharacterized protein LOC127853991 isoform X1 [Dreissena polymorpha]|uniref:uncharacterized protein LOC127853991 isoform X1 n=1 Tax=Dreissena polymorpha TaxID=45954 RepID=UPI002263B30C|nr:uncharacterized protein LOC127853991 isoform X1 [Dreissena polymorpha]
MNLQRLRSNRGGTKRTIAILLEKIVEKKENETRIEINSLLKNLETKVQMLETLYEKILLNTETEEIEDEIVETDIYMMDLRMKLDILIAERDQRDTSIVSQQPTFHPMDTLRGRGDTGLGSQQTTFHPLDAQRDQQDTSIGSQQPTFHPMDTQRGRRDTGLGGQQTTFHHLAQRDQRDTSIGSQQPTFHPMDTQRGEGDTGLGGQQTTFHPLAQRDQADTRLNIQQTTFHPDDTPLTLENRNKHALHNPVDTIHLTAVQHERVPCSFQFRRKVYDGSRAAHDRRSPYPYGEYLDLTRSEYRQSNQHNSHVNIATEFPFVSGLSNMVGVPETPTAIFRPLTHRMSPPGTGYEPTARFHFNGVYPTLHYPAAAAHLQPHPTHSVYRNRFSHKGRYANVNLVTPLWPKYGGRSERPEPTYPSSADGNHERPRSFGDPAGTASSDKTSVSSAEMKSERTDGGLETETISVSRSPSPQSFQWASSQSRDTSMPDFSSSSDSKHSSGIESEDQKPNVLSEKSRGDSPTVSSTVTASHQDSHGSPPAQRTPYHHPSNGAASVGFGFRYTSCTDVNMNMYPHAQRAPVEQTYEAAAKLLFMYVQWTHNQAIRKILSVRSAMWKRNREKLVMNIVIKHVRNSAINS